MVSFQNRSEMRMKFLNIWTSWRLLQKLTLFPFFFVFSRLVSSWRTYQCTMRRTSPCMTMLERRAWSDPQFIYLLLIYLLNKVRRWITTWRFISSTDVSLFILFSHHYREEKHSLEIFAPDMGQKERSEETRGWVTTLWQFVPQTNTPGSESTSW